MTRKVCPSIFCTELEDLARKDLSTESWKEVLMNIYYEYKSLVCTVASIFRARRLIALNCFDFAVAVTQLAYETGNKQLFDVGRFELFQSLLTKEHLRFAVDCQHFDCVQKDQIRRELIHCASNLEDLLFIASWTFDKPASTYEEKDTICYLDDLARDFLPEVQLEKDQWEILRLSSRPNSFLYLLASRNEQ